LLRKALLSAVVIALFGALTPAASAKTAALLCSGTSCDGLDPKATRCDAGARTLDTEDTDGWVGVELRYSPACNAVWARIDNYRGVSGVAKVIGYSGGRFVREDLKQLAAYPGEKAWTKMISATYTTYACYRRFNDLIGWTEWCTGGH
jgi:hypothetical protein